MAKAATLTIVEAENIVPVGSIDPNDVDLPGIFVDRIVPATDDKHIEIRKLRSGETTVAGSGKDEARIQRELIGRRAAKELKPGFYVNLGVGIPTLAPSFLPKDVKVWIQSENGILGMVSFARSFPQAGLTKIGSRVIIQPSKKWIRKLFLDVLIRTPTNSDQRYHQCRKRNRDLGSWRCYIR
jgi:acyl CoA:acetate/3-ketoacid CoA transferase